MMKTFTKITSALMIAVAVCWGTGVMAQSYDCASAVAITDATASVTGNTVGANDNATSGAITCGTSVGTGGQNWYAYTPSVDVDVTLTTCGGSTFDTKIHVYCGGCGAFSCVTGNDDVCGLQSTVSFQAAAGNTYYIRVGGFSSSAGAYTMFITSTPTGANYGCTDPAACNYEPGAVFATCCDYSCSGCTDPAACNFDPGASVDDGSCVVCASNCLQISVGTGTFPGEISWSFEDGSGVIASGGAGVNTILCVANDCDYVFTAVDSFGDGWNGAVLNITNLTTGEVYVNEIPSGPGEVYNLVIGAGLVPGCTDPLANNYNPAANCDDGSCLACPPGDVLLIFNMFDTFGDGWSGATYSFTDDLGNVQATGTLVAGAFGQALVCLPPGCYFLTVSGGTFPTEVSWEAADQGGNVLFSGGAPTTNFGFSWAGQTGCVIPGCTDANCNNYNPYATVNDGSCQCPPANDECSGAQAIGCGVSVIGTTEFANLDAQPTCGTPLTAPGVWYTLVGDGSQVTLSTCASTSGIDTRIHVYTSGFVADCNALTCVASNDDGCPGFLSSITFTTINGGIYYVLVSEFGVGQGLEFQLDVNCQVCANPLPSNDDCAGAEQQIDGIASVQDLCCVNPDNSVCIGFTTGYGVWFYLNSTPAIDPLGCGAADTFDFMVTNLTGANVGMTVYEDLGNAGCANLNPIACCPIVTGACGGDISQIWTISPGTDYYFLVYTTDPIACGEISLMTELAYIGCTDATADNYDPCATIDSGTCIFSNTPPNDLCANAVTITCGSTTTGSTGGATNADYPFVCNFTNDPGVWYTATGDGQLWTISTCGSAIDSHIEIYEGPCGGPLVCLADVVSDFIGCGFFDQDDATFQFVSTPGANYLIYVMSDSFDTAFDISLSCEPVVFGCTISAACNYNPAANVDDGNCDFFSCTCGGGSGTPVQLNMFDAFGDGWDSGSYTITDGLGNIVASNTLDNADYVVDEDNFVGGESGFDLLCLADGCYSITVGGSAFNSEISWNLVDQFGNILASGGAPASAAFSIGGNCGCTSASACNFDPTATVDDGSCCFGDCATLTVTGGSFPTEISWEINGVTGGAPFTGVICLTDPCLNTFNMFDLFGDGWNGATYTFVVNGNVIATGTMAGASASVNISVGIQGCTDAGACNYNPAASCDDGSCCLENCVNVNLFDSFGDGWNNAIYSVIDAGTGTVVASGTLATGSFGQVSLCLPTGCYEWQVTAGFIPSEVSWTIFGTDSGNISGGAPSSTLFSVGGSNCTAGCQVPTACNYDPTAGIDDCTVCDYTSCLGCTYVDADNYNPAAIIDDGSCTGFASDCPADFNQDGIVGVSDLLFFIGQYGTTCD